jgi:hypothetical protein
LFRCGRKRKDEALPIHVKPNWLVHGKEEPDWANPLLVEISKIILFAN